jgi:lipopolysaccharide export system permease protein
VLDIDRDFRLVERLDAKKARWTPAGWLLSSGVVHRIDAQNRVRSEAFDSRLGALSERIDDFTQVQRPVDTLSFLELRAFVEKLRESGHQVGKYMVQLYARVSFPLVHFIMALVGIPALFPGEARGGHRVATAIAIGYWMVHSIALALAQADMLPPALAAWTANIIFAGLGTALFLNART